MHDKLMKLTRASRDRFLYKHNGMTMETVTNNTTPIRTDGIELSHVGVKRIKTLDKVSPTTTLYDIIAAKEETILFHYLLQQQRLTKKRVHKL